MKALACTLLLVVLAFGDVGASRAKRAIQDTCELQPHRKVPFIAFDKMDSFFSQDKRFLLKLSGSLMFTFKEISDIKHLNLHVREINSDPKANNAVLFQTECANIHVTTQTNVTDQTSTISRINIKYRFVDDGQTFEGVCNVQAPDRLRWPAGTHYACHRTMVYPCAAEGPAPNYSTQMVLDAFELEAREEPTTFIEYLTKQALC